jgi:hypothetical protein
MPGMPQPPTLTPPGPAVPPRPAIDVDKLRAQLTADYDKRLPLWKTGAEIVVYRRGIGVKGSLVQVAAGNVVLSQEAGQLEIPLAELDNNSQFRLDAAYRTAAIEQTIKQRLAAAATAPAPPR